MKHTTTTLGLIGAVALLGACAQLEQASKTNAASLSNMSITGGDCTGKLSTEEGAAGIFGIQLLRNHATGKIQLLGKAFVATKTLPVDPYVLLGEIERSKADRMAIRKGITLDSFGDTIDIALGLNPEDPQVVQPNPNTKASAVRALLRASTNQAADGSVLMVSLTQSPKYPPGFYVADYKDGLGSLVEDETEESADAAAGTGEQAVVTRPKGVKAMHSFVVDAKKLGPFAVNIPTNPEPQDKPYGSGIPVENGNIQLILAGDTNVPNGVKSRLLIQFAERKSQPGWLANCYRPDVPAGGGTVSIPTSWKTAQGKEESISGTYYVTVFRSHVRTTPIPSEKDENGNAKGDARKVIIDARSGFLTQGTVPKN